MNRDALEMEVEINGTGSTRKCLENSHHRRVPLERKK